MSFTTGFELACAVAVLIIGMVTCVAVSSRLKAATLPLAGLFVLAADSKLFWPHMSAFCVVEQLGYIEVLRDRPWVGIWYYTWHLLPVLLAGFFAWALARELRRALRASG
ncbi:MAG: hypothetical protein KAY37_11045 [Phycisphaerae bacterium]|nr:hypothetical protein [Phycisphaerae bacterium]